MLSAMIRARVSTQSGSRVIAFTAAVVLLSAISYRWAARNFATLPPPWDQSLYLYMAFRFWNALMDGGLPALAHSWLHLVQDRGPLFPLTTLAPFLVFGPSLQTAYLTNAPYLAVLLASVFKTAQWLGGRRAGLLAAFMAATTPALINYSRDYLLDFPMAALISAAIYTLLRSDLFRIRGYSLAFGSWSGLALLAKPMAAAYLFPIALYAVLVASTQPERRRGLLGSLGPALLGLALVAAPWYSVNLVPALGNLVFAGFGAGSAPYRDAGERILTWDNVSYYLRFGPGLGLGLPYALLLSCLATWRGIRGWREGNWAWPGIPTSLDRPATILVVWLATMYVILTVTPNKSFERYTVALLPAIAVLTACWIRLLSPPVLRAVVTASAVVSGLFTYGALTFGIAALPLDIQWKGVMMFSQVHYLRRLSPHRERWPIHDALATLASQLPGGPCPAATVYVMPNHPMVNALTLMAHAEEKRYPFSFTIHGEKVTDRARVRSFDFVVTKTGEDQGPGFLNIGHEEARRAFEEVAPDFTVLQRLPLPDGSYLELFKRRSPDASSMEPPALDPPPGAAGSRDPAVASRVRSGSASTAPPQRRGPFAGG